MKYHKKYILIFLKNTLVFRVIIVPHFGYSCHRCARLLCVKEEHMDKSNRKIERKRLKDALTGKPLTQKQFADLVNAYEVENRQETQVSAYKDGLGRFVKSKGLLVLALLLFPPLTVFAFK